MSARVLVVNCGSSSVKFDVFELPGEANPLQGAVERVGTAGARLKVSVGGAREERPVDAPDTAAAVRLALDFVDERGGAPAAVGHRVVHGGSAFSASALIDEGVVARIEACTPLAPLHNPANLQGILEMRRRLPEAPQVAVFDTAFHASLPAEAATYAIPRRFERELGYRRYGFHGTSHAYVAGRAAAMLVRPLESLRLVTLHLGNGASACAVERGRSVETSMGLTPLEGLVMGTRSGDVDPALVLRLARELGVDEAERVLNRESGLLGISGVSGDMRDLEAAAEAGNPDADFAIRVSTRRLRRYVGAYAAAMDGLDAIVFTGGIGENSARTRREVAEGLGVLGVRLDVAANAARREGERDVAAAESRVRLLVVPTDEERAILREVARLALPGAGLR